MVDADKLIVQVSADIKDLKANLSQAQKEISKFSGNSQNELTNFKTIFAGVFSAQAAVQFAQEAGRAVAKFIQESVQLFSEFETKARAFNELLGTEAPAALARMQAAAQGTASSMELMASANKAVLLGLPTEDLGLLVDVSRKLGLAMGRDTTDAFNDLSIGIGRQSKLILDNLGLVVKSEEVYKQYADALGTTSEKLSETEKKTAFYNATITQAVLKSVELGDQQDTLAYQSQRLSTQITELKINIGEQLSSAAKEAKTALADMLTIINYAASSMRTFDAAVKEAAEGGNKLAQAQQILKNPLAAIIDLTNLGTHEIALNIQKQQENAAIIETLIAKRTAEAEAQKLQSSAGQELLSRLSELVSSGNMGTASSEELKKAFEEVAAAAAKEGISLRTLVAELNKTTDATTEAEKAQEEYKAIEYEISGQTLELKEQTLQYRMELRDLESQMRDLDETLQQQRDTLSKYEEQLSAVRDRIRELMDPLFQGQRLNEEQIWQLEQLIKQQKKNMLWMDKESEEYKSAQERIDFLNTKLEELRLGYEINYGGMKHEVELHAQAHEDASNTIFSSVDQVISALDQQWQSETRLQAQIENQKAVIKNTEADRAALQKDAQKIRDAIEDINEEIAKLDLLLEKKRRLLVETEYRDTGRSGGGGAGDYTEVANTLMEDVTGGRGGGGYIATYESTYSDIYESAGGGVVGAIAAGIAAPIVSAGHALGFEEGGIVPETGLIFAHKGETIIPAEESGAMNRSIVINIGTINASNAEEIAEKIASEVNSRITW